MTDEPDPGGDRGFALWGSRFRRPLAESARALNRSLPVDRRLWREELEVSAAWADELAAIGALSADEARELKAGLAAVGERLESSGISGDEPDEDVHTLVERLLADEVGDLAGKLRTGRSRNDQVSTIARLWTMRAIDRLDGALTGLQAALLDRAEASPDVIVPAYTHLQRAQPVPAAHFFLSHFWPLARDRERWAAARDRAAELPLGSGAVAGSGYPVDRERLGEALGFRTVMRNSMDAASDRDFVLDFAYAGALTGVHLSRLAEDLILFASAEFGFLRFDDAYSTGSSLMPQKRNPDIAELARGGSARLVGELVAGLTLLKGLPSGYNKDLQEDKPVLFGIFETLDGLLPALAGAVETLEVDRAAASAALEPAMLAVDVADALVREGVPFRDAHAAVGTLVRQAEARGRSIFGLPDEEVAEIHPKLAAALATFGAQGSDRFRASVESRRAIGGTARERILEQIEAARSLLTD